MVAAGENLARKNPGPLSYAEMTAYATGRDGTRLWPALPRRQSHHVSMRLPNHTADRYLPTAGQTPDYPVTVRHQSRTARRYASNHPAIKPVGAPQAAGRQLGPKRILISANSEVSRLTRNRSPKVSTCASPFSPIIASFTGQYPGWFMSTCPSCIT